MSGGLRERDQQEVESRRLVLLALLGTSQTSRTWIAADPAGHLHVARRLSGLAEAEMAALRAQLSRLAEVRHPSLLSPEHSWVEEAWLWAVRPHDPGVSLRRLTAVARLDARQVAAIGADVLEGLATLQAAGAGHGALHPGNILVGLDGRARIADMGLGARSADGDSGGEAGARQETDDLEAAAAALRTALAPTPRRNVPLAGEPRRSEGLGALAAVLGGPGPAFGGAASAVAAQAALLRALGEADVRVRREINALVAPLRPPRTVPTPPLAPASVRVPSPSVTVLVPGLRAERTAIAGPELGPEPRPIPAPASWHPEPRASPPLDGGSGAGLSAVRVRVGTVLGWLMASALGPLWGRVRTRSPHLTAGWRPRSGWRPPTGWRLVAWLAPVVAVAVVVAGLVVLGGRPSGAVAGLTTPQPSASGPSGTPRASASGPASRSGATPSVGPTPSHAASPPAPATAGTVAGVTIDPAGSGGCAVAPGSSCLMRVQVNLDPQQAPVDVSFDMMVVDACTGASSTVSGGSVTAPPGSGYVWSDASLGFSSSDSVTVYAVTSAPAQAASPGLTLAGSTTCR